MITFFGIMQRLFNFFLVFNKTMGNFNEIFKIVAWKFVWYKMVIKKSM